MNWFCQFLRRCGLLWFDLHPSLRFAVYGTKQATSQFSDDIKSRAFPLKSNRILYLRMRLGGALFERAVWTAIYPFLPILLSSLLWLGVFLLSICFCSSSSSSLRIPLLLCIAAAYLSTILLLEQRPILHQTWRAELFSFLVVFVLLAISIQPWNPVNIWLGLLATSILRILAMALLHNRDLAGIFLYLVDYDEPLPALLPCHFSDKRIMVYAMRLLSPTVKKSYRELDKKLDRIDSPIWQGINDHEPEMARRISGTGLNTLPSRVEDDLWAVVRFSIGRITGHQLPAFESSTAEKEEKAENKKDWWQDAMTAYFTAKLHLTQIKLYALLIVTIFASSLVYGLSHPYPIETPEIPDSARHNVHETCNKTACVELKDRNRGEGIESSTNSLKVTFAAGAVIWVALAIYFRRYQLNRLVSWEIENRRLSEKGMQLFMFQPDKDTEKRWYEIRDEDYRIPIREFGASHGEVFHFIEASLLVFVMLLLHALHF